MSTTTILELNCAELSSRSSSCSSKFNSLSTYHRGHNYDHLPYYRKAESLLFITMASISHLAHDLSIARYELEEANQQLAAERAENATLREEAARLRQNVSPEPKRRSQLSSQPKPPSREESIEPLVPRYARATKASGQRSTNSTVVQAQYLTMTSATTPRSDQPAVSGRNHELTSPRASFSIEHQHRDHSSAKTEPGYMRATKSSAAKSCPKSPGRATENKVTWSEPQPGGPSQSGKGNTTWAANPGNYNGGKQWLDDFRKPWTLDWLHGRQPWPLELSATEYKDLIDHHQLVPATRLEDDKWLETPLKYMYIDDGQQARLLIQGKEVAQKCLWNFAEQRLPPGHNPWTVWQQVRFEWGVLSQTWGTSSEYYSLLKFRATEPYLVWNTMRSLIQLRHATSHYSPSSDLFPSSLSQVDTHLKNVQKFAIQLYDERRALETRQLRDQLRQAAQNTLNELEALRTLFSLPFAGYPWKQHHERVLRCLLIIAQNSHEDGVELDECFPGDIRRMAEDWVLLYGWRGNEYKPPVSLGACSRTPPQRRHSIYGHQDSDKIPNMVARIKADREWQQRNGCEAPYDVPAWLIMAHGQGAPASSPRARRRLSC